jgi:hypothetical protein
VDGGRARRLQIERPWPATTELIVRRSDMEPRSKSFKIPGDQITQLIPSMGGCFASDRITVDGMKVGYMYREEANEDFDSGWRFFSGDETQEYADDPDNFAIYDVNTVCNYDPAIIPLLDAPIGAAFGRLPSSDQFRPSGRTIGRTTGTSCSRMIYRGIDDSNVVMEQF